MTKNGTEKTRVAILGGGIAALTAAFELTEQDPGRSSLDITVYSLGWRLGGKAAVGRNPSQYDRAYEHGLHIWAGFYDNAFDIVKRLYARLGKGLDAWKSCFEPLNHFTVMENVDGTWKPWLLQFPPNDLTPGLGPTPPLAPLSLLVQLLAALENGFNRSDLAGYLSSDVRIAMAAEIAALPSIRTPKDNETVLTVAREAAEKLPSDPSQVGVEPRDVLIQLLAFSQRQVESAIANSPQTDDARRFRIFYDLAFSLARGLLSDKLFFGGFAAIDDVEWSKWMLCNGCKPETLESAVVRGCYDYAFAPRKPGIGAGTATLLVLRFLLTYKGSVLHALREPMGDNLIAPLFEYLRDWGVSFEFFCRVKELQLSQTEPVVESIVLAQQVQLANGASKYEPLISRSDGSPSWPIRPDSGQIVNGDLLYRYDLESAWTNWPDAIPKRVLRRRSAELSTDHASDVFDIIVLATGFGGLESICHDFKARFPDTWGKFLETTVTTQTIALQLWLRPQIDELGWSDPATALTGFERPEDKFRDAPLTSWEDNTRLLRLEGARHDSPPRNLGYFVGVFPDAHPIPEPGTDPTFPDKEHERAKAAILPWMNQRLGILWPNAAIPMPPRFRWELLDAPPDAMGQDRLNFQYWRVNINPSERYVLSVPGSVEHRLWPDGSGIDNLFLAGDWVRSGVNAGCIEAAVIAGRMVARAITEADMTIPGDGNSGEFSLPVGALPLINVADKFKSAAAGGIGAIDAYCATIPVSVDFAKAKLPTGLRLVTPPHWTKYHPLVLVFSRQRNVRPGFVPLGGLNYHEFLELIPYVERSDINAPSGGPFSYMPYLLLDQTLAVLVGANLYGFNKRLARISAHGGAFDIISDLGEVRASFSGDGLPGTIGKFPSIDRSRKFLELPFISQMPTGEWVYSFLDYRLDTATFQIVDGEIAIGPPFAPAVDGKRSAADVEWFRFSANWRLSVPLSSGQLSDTSVSGQLRRTLSQWTQDRLFRR